VDDDDVPAGLPRRPRFPLERESVEPLVAGVAEIRAERSLLVRGRALEQLRQFVRVGCFEARDIEALVDGSCNPLEGPGENRTGRENVSSARLARVLDRSNVGRACGGEIIFRCRARRG
jgi:hypothetical protein